MAARHLDEGLLGWLYAAAAVAGGLGLCALGGYLVRTIARDFDEAIAPIDSDHD